MRISPGRGNDAPPVLTSKIDDLTTFKVFRGWKSDEDQQISLNPWIEMEKAREKRDEIIRIYGVRLLDFVGKPKTERITMAQHNLMRHLRDRGWSRHMAMAYFGRHISRNEWIKAVTTRVLEVVS